MKTIILLSTFFMTLSVIQDSRADEIIYTDENRYITEDVTWTADNTYRVQTELTIWRDGHLTVEAGTRVTIEAPNFDEEDHDIAVRFGGEIAVMGTSTSPVLFEWEPKFFDSDGNPTTEGRRQGSLFLCGTGDIHHAIFKGAHAGISISRDDTDRGYIEIRDSEFTDNYFGILINSIPEAFSYDSPLRINIVRSHFHDNIEGIKYFADNAATLQIAESVFQGNRDLGVGLGSSGGNVLLWSNLITDNDFGVQVGICPNSQFDDTVFIEKNTIINNRADILLSGPMLVDGGSVFIHNNILGAISYSSFISDENIVTYEVVNNLVESSLSHLEGLFAREEDNLTGRVYFFRTAVPFYDYRPIISQPFSWFGLPPALPVKYPLSIHVKVAHGCQEFSNSLFDYSTPEEDYLGARVPFYIPGNAFPRDGNS